MRISFLVLLAVALGGCAAADPAAADAYRVLFVGNSLTYTHDLPDLVEALAEAGGHGPLVTESVARPDYALDDHWHDGAAREALRRGGWDLVVLQQGPSSQPASRAHLRTWALQWAEAARAEGAAVALYMVWPSAARQGDFPGVVRSYTDAAEASGALLLPAGAAWLEAWDRDPALALYGPDGFHPSVLGTYAAAVTVYGALFRASPEGLPASVRGRGRTWVVDPRDASVVQRAAAAVLAAPTE